MGHVEEGHKEFVQRSEGTMYLSVFTRPAVKYGAREPGLSTLSSTLRDWWQVV